jgi:hypothetical protein
MHNDEKKRFEWIVAVRSEFGDFQPDELQVRLADDHIELVGLQQQWRSMTGCHARRSFEVRHALPFPLDERSVYVHETEEGSVAVEATGSGLLQQLLTGGHRTQAVEKRVKPSAYFAITPYAASVSSTETLLRTLLGSTDQPSATLEPVKVKPAPANPESESVLALFNRAVQSQRPPITNRCSSIVPPSVPVALAHQPKVPLSASTTSAASTVSHSETSSTSKRVNIDDLLQSIQPKVSPKPPPAMAMSVAQLMQSASFDQLNLTPAIREIMNSLQAAKQQAIDSSNPKQSNSSITIHEADSTGEHSKSRKTVLTEAMLITSK